MRPCLGWTSSSSVRNDGETDAPGKVAINVVTDRCLVYAGCILDIVMSCNFKRVIA